MKSEFEKLFKSQRSYRSSDKEAFIRGCEAAFKHQQSKVDELQKGNDALVHVIKSRDIQLENEKHEYDKLMSKLVDSGMKNTELQKRVDAVTEVLHDIKDGMAGESLDMQFIGRQLERALKGVEE